MKPLLTRQQCTAMRGLAIIGIMLHNYCHAFPFAIKESEFGWNIDETMRWPDYLQHVDSYLLINLISWWGSYILPAFMFLGGYGLVRKYEDGNAACRPLGFIFKQYRKLLALVLVPLLTFVVVQLVALHSTFATPLSVLAQLGMVVNLIPALKIVPFPYWYLGMMMQLYVIYALVVYPFRGRWSRLGVPLALIAAGIALHMFVRPDSAAATYVRINSPVAFIPFGMGLLAARYGRSSFLSRARAAVLLPVILLLVIVFSLNYYLWGLTYGAGALAVICIAAVLSGRLLNWAVKVGEVSALVYILHPITRFVVMLPAQKFFPEWVHTQVLIYILLTALTVYFYHKLKINERTLKILGGR